MQGNWNRWTEDNEMDTGDPLDGERRLVASILTHAIRDCVSKVDCDERQEATQWIDSRSQEPFGFEWCCDMLDLSAEQIRSLIENRKGYLYRALYYRNKVSGDERRRQKMLDKLAKAEAEAARLRAALDRVSDTTH